MALGFSFQPGQDQPQGGGPLDQRLGGGPSATPQDAVKILSLRVPRTLPSNAPVNRALLAGPGGIAQGGAAPGAGGLNSLIAALTQLFQGSSRQLPNELRVNQGPVPSDGAGVLYDQGLGLTPRRPAPAPGFTFEEVPGPAFDSGPIDQPQTPPKTFTEPSGFPFTKPGLMPDRQEVG